MTYWGDLNARARGLGTHVFRRERLEALTAATDLATLADRLGREGVVAEEPGEGLASSLELAVRSATARRLATIARWAGQRTETLVVIFEDEDRRSLRAIVRGAIEGVARDARLLGLVPTPLLPERALQALAALDTAADVARLLVAWGNPYGAPICDEAQQSHPDLFRLETLVNRRFVERSLSASRRRPALRAHVRRVIDLGNVLAALDLVARGNDVPPALCFLEGGDLVSRDAFLAAAGAGTPQRAALELSGVFDGTPYSDVLTRHAADITTIEGKLLTAQLAEVERWRRIDPLSPAPLLAFALGIRAEALDLRRIIWGTALGTPRGLITSDFATPP